MTDQNEFELRRAHRLASVRSVQLAIERNALKTVLDVLEQLYQDTAEYIEKNNLGNPDGTYAMLLAHETLIKFGRPVTGRVNREWLMNEVADALAGIELLIEHFELPMDYIFHRKCQKKVRLREWHQMA